MTTPSEAYVGIDVGKTWLDVILWGDESVWRAPNDETGVAEIMVRVVEMEPQLIAIEASGGYEQLLVQGLLVESLPVAVVNPTRKPVNRRIATGPRWANVPTGLAAEAPLPGSR